MSAALTHRCSVRYRESALKANPIEPRLSLKPYVQRVLRGHRAGEVWTCDITADSIFSGARDGVGKVWDRETGANYLNLEAHTSSIFHISAGQGPAGAHSVLTCGGDGSVVFWDLRQGKPGLTLAGDAQPIFTADVIAEHMVVVAGGDMCAARYDLRSGRKVLRFAGHKDSIWDLDVNSLSQRLLTVGADCALGVWDNLTGDHLATLSHHLEPITTVKADASRAYTGDSAGCIMVSDFAVAPDPDLQDSWCPNPLSSSCGGINLFNDAS